MVRNKMMEQKSFSVKKMIKSFGFAVNGLRILIREEHNARIHLFVAGIVIIASVGFGISAFEWMVVILAIGFVLGAEIVNSAIENMADFISPEKDERIKTIKDLSAAGVLVSAVTAASIGLFVFFPKFWIVINSFLVE
jgi:diacylglycerol kinase